MDDAAASSTALTTSLMRALHSRLNPHPLIDDRWGEVLVPKAQCGLDLIEDLSGSQAVARYGRSDDASLSRPSSSHLALARVKHQSPPGGGAGGVIA
jgi:O-methyltransferase involved in polyketide biosynthesis